MLKWGDMVISLRLFSVALLAPLFGFACSVSSSGASPSADSPDAGDVSDECPVEMPDERSTCFASSGTKCPYYTMSHLNCVCCAQGPSQVTLACVDWEWTTISESGAIPAPAPLKCPEAEPVAGDDCPSNVCEFVQCTYGCTAEGHKRAFACRSAKWEATETTEPCDQDASVPDASIDAQ